MPMEWNLRKKNAASSAVIFNEFAAASRDTGLPAANIRINVTAMGTRARGSAWGLALRASESLIWFNSRFEWLTIPTPIRAAVRDSQRRLWPA